MEITTPFLVALLLGSLLFTCIASACAAKFFRRKKSKLEKNYLDLESHTGSRKMQQGKERILLPHPILHQINSARPVYCSEFSRKSGHRYRQDRKLAYGLKTSTSSIGPLNYSPVLTISGSRVSNDSSKLSLSSHSSKGSSIGGKSYQHLPILSSSDQCCPQSVPTAHPQQRSFIYYEK
ncbi:uncharacterized protein LOC143461053 [Clavelina lepadiformis]|uniref:uncharacterized protein LOC143461053 n=1 Tax=Clavelina lepadiformis TaxID=159417 RepID=UPI0040429B3E